MSFSGTSFGMALRYSSAKTQFQYESTLPMRQFEPALKDQMPVAAFSFKSLPHHRFYITNDGFLIRIKNDNSVTKCRMFYKFGENGRQRSLTDIDAAFDFDESHVVFFRQGRAHKLNIRHDSPRTTGGPDRLYCYSE